MDHTEQIAQRLEHVAAELIEVIALHETMDHAGEPCRSARASALGYLAFRIDIVSEGQMLLASHYRLKYQAAATRKEQP